MGRSLRICICLSSLIVLGSCAFNSPLETGAWRNPKDGMEFVSIPAGHLTVQIRDDSAGSDGKIGRDVALERGFWLGRTEVTVGQFRCFVRETGYITEAEKAGHKFSWREPGFKQTDGHPVVYLSYEDARRYADWAGVDLPTEIEWVYACRAGATTTFHWGDELDDRYLWHRGNTEGTGTRPVARKRPNDWGLYDMVGNAWEYCHAEGSCWAMRGGAWSRCPTYRGRLGNIPDNLCVGTVEPTLARCDPNPKYPPYPWDDDRGFRCIRRIISRAK